MIEPPASAAVHEWLAGVIGGDIFCTLYKPT